MTEETTAAVGSPTIVTHPVRIFVGLKMAPEIASELARIARELEGFDVRLVAADDIHLTLVPPWNEISIPDAINKLRPVATRFDAFSLTIQHVGYGPDPRRPRLLWADCAATDELAALRAGLLGVYGQTDERPFRPHVTLARIRSNGRAISRKCPVDRHLFLMQRIESVALFQSPPPGERGYRTLTTMRLGETAYSASNSQFTVAPKPSG